MKRFLVLLGLLLLFFVVKPADAGQDERIETSVNLPEKAEIAFRQEEAKSREREEKMWRELSDSDVADVPAERLHVEKNEKMRYFLIGADLKKAVPESGYGLLVVLPGGDGSAEFHPFVRRIWKNVKGESDLIVAQPIAVRWIPDQRIVWPTEKVRVEKQKFSSEQFVEAVVADIAHRIGIDPKYVLTMSWSSSGPAAYAMALQEKTSITGSYIVMSVFKSKELPPLKNARGRLFAIQHSPDDRVCPFRMAQDAEKQLKERGATVRFTEHPGGHGWRGDIYERMRENIDWLREKQNHITSLNMENLP